MQVNVSDGPDHFKDVGAGVFAEMVDQFSLGETSNVVDMGCGCGRVATSFTRLITNASYWGIDGWKEGIDWCRSNISSRQSNFHFITVPSSNNSYFKPLDTSQWNHYSLKGVAHGSVDLCVAVSLFTHLTRRDSASYLRVVRRVLARGGAAFITCFIIDRHFAVFSGRAGHHPALKEAAEDDFHAYGGQDFFAGFSMPAWGQLLKECGLKVVSYEAGKCAEKPEARPYPDTSVLGRDDWQAP